MVFTAYSGDERPLSPMLYMLGFQPMDISLKTYLSRSLVISIFTITWCIRSTGALTCVFLVDMKTGLVLKSFRIGVKSCLKFYPFFKHNLEWTRVYSKPCVVQKMAYRGRWFIYLLIITAHNLIDVIPKYFVNFNLTRGRVNHIHAGETNIILNDSASQMLFHYRLIIWLYKVHMKQIPRF